MQEMNARLHAESEVQPAAADTGGPGVSMLSQVNYALSLSLELSLLTHAEEGEGLQAAGAGLVPESRLGDAVEGEVVVPLQRILAAQRHPRRLRRLHHLLQQACTPGGQ
jgi:hypothetical protein